MTRRKFLAFVFGALAALPLARNAHADWAEDDAHKDKAVQACFADYEDRKSKLEQLVKGCDPSTDYFRTHNYGNAQDCRDSLNGVYQVPQKLNGCNGILNQKAAEIRRTQKAPIPLPLNHPACQFPHSGPTRVGRFICY